MGDQALLQRVPRSGLRIGEEIVPLSFFRHGQPGRRFAVCPEERGWRIHVRATDNEAIRNAYRQFAATRPPRKSRRRRNRAGKQTAPVVLSAGIHDPANPTTGVLAAPSNDSTTLKDAERRELERANALAVQLVEMKTRLMNTGWAVFADKDKGLLRIQELHARHLDRCMRLRLLLSGFVRGPGEDRQPA